MSNHYRTIRLSDVRVGRRTKRLVRRTLKSGQLASGPRVIEFEERLRLLTNSEHFAAVSNGTSALQLALKTASLGPGDEVITTCFTFGATWNAILSSGASLRYVDISTQDFNLDLLAVQERVCERTKAIVPVHLYGLPSDLSRIRDLALSHQLRVIEDCAQALGAVSGGLSVGTIDIGTFSFYATKNLTTGEGGGVTCRSSDDFRKVKLLRNQGFLSRYDYELLGENHRMTDVAASIGLGEISGYKTQVERRRYNARRMSDGLAGVSEINLPTAPKARDHVWHQFTIVLTSGDSDERDRLKEYLALQQIESGVYYPLPLHEYPCFREHPRVIHEEATPVANRIAQSCLSLPVHQRLKESDLDRVIETIRKFFGQ
jgi:perosamine synthetase